jgi:hypothetical protein
MIGVALTVAGAALFLRYSLAGFLRFWMARLSYEQKAQTDRIVASLGGAPASGAPSASTPTAAAAPSADTVAAAAAPQPVPADQ